MGQPVWSQCIYFHIWQKCYWTRSWGIRGAPSSAQCAGFVCAGSSHMIKLIDVCFHFFVDRPHRIAHPRLRVIQRISQWQSTHHWSNNDKKWKSSKSKWNVSLENCLRLTHFNWFRTCVRRAKWAQNMLAIRSSQNKNLIALDSANRCVCVL